jgi:hypothetical protein
MTILSHSPAGARSRVASKTLGGLQEGVLVAPDEIDFQQLQPQVAAVRLAFQCDTHQIRGLIVQAIGHVEVGFGQRIALIQVDRALARHGVVGGLEVRSGLGIARFRAAAAEIGHGMLARFFHDEGFIAPAIAAELGGRVAVVGDAGRVHAREIAAATLTTAPGKEGQQQNNHANDAGGNLPIRGQPIQP